MIAKTDQTRLLATLQRDWDSEVRSKRFRDICTGKERGHRIADYAEERTIEFISQDDFSVAFEHGPDLLPRARSMGDIWLMSGSPRIYNPINVKAGIAGVGGQPNMVSLEKLTQGILNHIIDSYWLLLLRFEINDSGTLAGIKLVNILDYLDFMHFDAGPGQIMLRSDRFYAHLEQDGTARSLNLADTVKRLVELRRDGDKRLAANREKRRLALEEKAEAFDPALPIDQSHTDLSRAIQLAIHTPPVRGPSRR